MSSNNGIYLPQLYSSHSEHTYYIYIYELENESGQKIQDNTIIII